MSEILLQERLLHLTGPAAAGEAATVLAAASPEDWRPGLARITDKTGERSEDVQALLATWVAAWNRAPDEIAQDRLAELSAVRDRLEDAEKQQPDWAAIARAIDPRLPEQPDWAALVRALDEAHADGHDVAAAVAALVAEEPLDDRPAQDLRYRLALALPVTPHMETDFRGTVTSSGLDAEQRRTLPTPAPAPGVDR